jgi:hypothetical protein
MLMCYEHHTVTNDFETYAVEVLRRYKSDHETRFSRPDRAILESLTDWTRLDEPSGVANLNRMSEVLRWREHGMSEDEHMERVVLLNAHIGKLQVIPVEVRRFVAAVSMRMLRAQRTHAVEAWGTSNESILTSDLKGALRLSDGAIFQRANEMEAYRLGSMDEMFVGDVGQPAVSIYRIGGWPLWLELAEFCEKAPENIEAFTDDLDFKRLDG